jgi:hypothetical protein
MTTPSAPNPVVQAALDALHAGDKHAWSSLFAPGAQLFDDGAPRDLAAFTDESLGQERFTKIQRVTNEGLDVYGDFHSDKWGNFPVYFKFYLDEDRKINRLEIGQA